MANKLAGIKLYVTTSGEVVVTYPPPYPSLSNAYLACTSLYWPILACTGLYWPILACTGL